MEMKTNKQKCTKSTKSCAKRRRFDSEMDDEQDDPMYELPVDTLVVNYPLVCITGELVGDQFVSAKQSRYNSSTNQRLITDFHKAEEIIQGVQETQNVCISHTKVDNLPVSINLLQNAEDVRRASVNDVEVTCSENVEELKQILKCKEPATEIRCSHKPELMITCESRPKGHTLSWPVSAEGKCKIFAPLREGQNIVSLKSKNGKCSMKFLYKPLENKRFVRPVYIICTNSDGSFDCPPGEDNSVESAIERISFNARILQTFTAEHLNIHGFGKQTFRLEEDESGNVKVNVFKSKLYIDKAIGMSGNDLYEYFHEELNNSELYDPLCKFWTFMSCTRYMPPKSDGCFDEKKISHYVKGHTALGGGNMALFGTGCLHTWARDLSELVSRFTDGRNIDKKSLFDDSSNRGFYWANYATTLGAAMHELGHTFNLPHTPSGIMGRGFDDMNCFFVCHGESRRNPTSIDGARIDVKVDRGAHWHRSSAAILSCSRWIGENNYDESPPEVIAPLMYINKTKRGPIGSGADASGQTVYFDLNDWLKRENVILKGFRLRANKYVNAFQIIGQSKLKLAGDNIGDSSDITLSRWFGNEKKDGTTHDFLLNDDERLISVDVRAGLWIDAIRLNSSVKSSAWIGGKGGNLYNLSFEDCDGFDNVIGTAGGEYITSIGITRVGEGGQSDNEENICYFYSPYGVRVVEVRQRNGEVLRHWEFLKGEPNKTVHLPKDDLFRENADTVAIYDSYGECGVYKLEHFKS